MSVSPANFPPTNSCLPACCFLLKCIHRGQVLPAQFELLLHQHHCNRITLRFGLRQWTITVTDHAFGEGWDVFCEHNIVKRHDTLLLRHSGNLIFDVIHFCELQKQVLLPWTVPLPDLLHLNSVASRDDIHAPTRHQQVASSLRPNFCQDLSDSVCFYQIFNSATPNNLKIPRFIDHFINGTKTPMLLINTGNKSARIGVKHKCLHKNWRDFILEHQLQHNETLVFVPEFENIFTALIFDDTGVEKIFPWEAVEKFVEKARKICDSLLHALAETLSVDGQIFIKQFDDEKSEVNVRVNYYPPCPRPDLALGITEHSDASALSVLVQFEASGGLQVFKDMKWLTVQWPVDALLINVGDLMEILSNGRFRSSWHRAVTQRDVERFSVALFYNPPSEAEIEPLKDGKSNNNHHGYKKVVVGEYLQNYYKISPTPTN